MAGTKQTSSPTQADERQASMQQSPRVYARTLSKSMSIRGTTTWHAEAAACGNVGVWVTAGATAAQALGQSMLLSWLQRQQPARERTVKPSSSQAQEKLKFLLPQ